MRDRFAIQDLIADYAYFWDAQDAERWARLFTPDGVFELYVPGIRPPVRRLTNLGERTTAARKAFALMGPQRTRLLNTSSRFQELTEDHALVRTISLVVELVESAGGGPSCPRIVGYISMSFARPPSAGVSPSVRFMETRIPDSAMPKILIPPQMRHLTDGLAEIEGSGATLQQLLRDTGKRYPKLRERVIADGGIAPGISIAIDGNVVSSGLLEPVPEGAEITIVPQISGGGGR